MVSFTVSIGGSSRFHQAIHLLALDVAEARPFLRCPTGGPFAGKPPHAGESLRLRCVLRWYELFPDVVRVALERGDQTEAIAAIEDLRATVLEGGRLV